MSTPTLKQEVTSLKRQVALLRSAVIGIIGERDPEGEYRPEFIKSTLEAMSRKPTKRFISPEQFLKDLAKVK